MAIATKTTPATDSARDLRDLVGNDTTATFEDDPTFVESNPTDTASSEHLLRAEDDEEEDDELEDEDDEEYDGEDEDSDEYEDDEEEDDEDELEDEDDDEDGEDDAEEVAATPATLLVDGLLGYEDEADDAARGRTRAQGDAARAASIDPGSDDDVADDGRESAVDEDKLRAEEEVDLDGEESSLDEDEAEEMRQKLTSVVGVPLRSLPPLEARL